MKRVQFPRLGEVCCETVLDNGLKIQVVPRPGYLKSYAFFATSYGGMNVRFRKDGVWQETPAGGAHFLEHKMFDTKEGNALQELAANGASPNAFTSNAITGYYFESTEKFEENLRILLGIWGITLLLPYVKLLAPLAGYAGNYGNMGLYGICDWNEFGTFHYVSGFAGYLVLAHYLVKFPPAWSWRRTLGVCIPLFAVGYLVTAFGYVLLQKHFPGNYAYLEIVWYFAGINVFMMTLPVFLVVQKLASRPRAWLARIAGATFGIYLCHFVFVQAGYDLIGRIPGLPVPVRIVLNACAAFAVSYGAVWLMQRNRITRRLVE